MSIAIGQQLGTFEITGVLGKGGMGEVYRARDTQLKREVALKVLPDAFGLDAERLVRFQREAEMLASLNHPNIAHVYGVQGRALVMELVEGESPKGPMAFDDAWSIARQIADALAYAHERGVIHRDLKPANVIVTPNGLVKLLDFGLAKAFSDVPEGASSADVNNSPTLTIGATQAGVILGTAAYMSPEQAKGRLVDKRTDIWSWAVVLYELLTGERMFGGEDVADTLAQVLTKEPDLERVPTHVRGLLRGCLEKDPRKRLRDIGDAHRLIEDSSPVRTIDKSVRRGVAGWITAALLFIALAFVLVFHFREPVTRQPLLEYTVAAPQDSSLHSFAISPNGRFLALAANVNGRQQIWLRALDALQLQPLPNTEGGLNPFWSPDSSEIGFVAQGRLKKISVSGGPATTLCPVVNFNGASWLGETIIFSAAGGIQKVSERGGTPIEVIKVEFGVRDPMLLPGGRDFIYVAGAGDKADLYVGSLDGKSSRRIFNDVSYAVFAPSADPPGIGRLVFIREDTLMTQPFNVKTGQLSGDMSPVAEGVALMARGPYTPVSVSDNGMMVYTHTQSDIGELLWFDRGGKRLDSAGIQGSGPAISPDQKSVAYVRYGGGRNETWIRDLASGRELRLTSDSSRNTTPVWSPKGDRIVYRSERDRKPGDMYERAASGAGQDRLLLATMYNKIPSQWSSDGQYIVYSENTRGNWGLHVLPLSAGQTVAPLLSDESDAVHGQLSPDGKWIAYASRTSGSSFDRDVYVRPFPPTSDERWKISTAGGVQPRWRGDGKELFYIAASGKMMAVKVDRVGAKLSFGNPIPLFDTHPATGITAAAHQYDVAADGSRFVIASATGLAPALTVKVNWPASIKR